MKLRSMHQIMKATLRVHIQQHGILSPDELATELLLAVRDELANMIRSHGHYVTETTKRQGESKTWNEREDRNARRLAAFLDLPSDSFTSE